MCTLKADYHKQCNHAVQNTSQTWYPCASLPTGRLPSRQCPNYIFVKLNRFVGVCPRCSRLEGVREDEGFGSE